MSQLLSYLEGIHAWDALTAIGTTALAAATFFVILQTKRQRADSERYHQNGLKPICILAPHDGVDPWHRRDTLLSIDEHSSPYQQFGVVEIRCALRNIGTGPALNVGIMFRFLDMNNYLTHVWELSPLPAGEYRGHADVPMQVPIQFGATFSRTDFMLVPGKLWEIVLVYEDIFGNHFYSVHHKRPLQLDKLQGASGSIELQAPYQSWITFGSGRYENTSQKS